MISIIIPFYGRADLIHARLNEFRQYVPKEGTEIILVNDGSSDLDCDGIVGFWQNVNLHTIRYLKHEQNMGFGKSMNDGADRAKGDILIFYSNDVVCKSNFTDEVASLIGNSDKVLVGGEYLENFTGWNKFDGKVIPYLNGWFLACTKAAWRELGGFDPIYAISDMEDVDLSYTASQKGFQLKALTSSKLHHIGGQTAGYTPERRQRTINNAHLFMNKWGFTQWDAPKS